MEDLTKKTGTTKEIIRGTSGSEASWKNPSQEPQISYHPETGFEVTALLAQEANWYDKCRRKECWMAGRTTLIIA